METVSVEEKREFVRWFLGKYQLRQKECAWILNQLLRDDVLLARTHFVSKARDWKNGIEMGTFHSETSSFVYMKDDKLINNPEEMYRVIQNNIKEGIFIQLEFPNKEECGPYRRVILDKVFDKKITEEKKKISNDFASLLLGEVLKEGNERRVKEKIDDSLRKKDREGFIFWTKELRRMTEGNTKG